MTPVAGFCGSSARCFVFWMGTLKTAELEARPERERQRGHPARLRGHSHCAPSRWLWARGGPPGNHGVSHPRAAARIPSREGEFAAGLDASLGEFFEAVGGEYREGANTQPFQVRLATGRDAGKFLRFEFRLRASAAGHVGLSFYGFHGFVLTHATRLNVFTDAASGPYLQR